MWTSDSNAKLFDRVLLKDGREGTIAEVLEPSVVYEFEYSTRGDGTALDVETIRQADIDRVVEPFEMDDSHHEA